MNSSRTLVTLVVCYFRKYSATILLKILTGQYVDAVLGKGKDGKKLFFCSDCEKSFWEIPAKARPALKNTATMPDMPTARCAAGRFSGITGTGNNRKFHGTRKRRPRNCGRLLSLSLNLTRDLRSRSLHP